ncbi:MAG: twin-arginine translocation signal domain-containing protein, partial [Rhodobiaceae bacterium]|nr:twin-arginine translocation signal domain-containing protein [Rhodobiaceae bacterium]
MPIRCPNIPSASRRSGGGTRKRPPRLPANGEKTPVTQRFDLNRRTVLAGAGAAGAAAFLPFPRARA